MHRTLESVMAQSIPPALWIIVDDGSSDESAEILAEFASQFECIRVVTRTDRGGRSVGPGVVDALNEGLQLVDLDQFQYFCKLDLDLELPPRYFEILMARMAAEPRLGTCSGKPYFPSPANTQKCFDGPLVSEAIGDEVSVGATKFYRVTCYRQIGGFVRQVNWDGIDCHRCRMLGWIARSWDDPELRFIHLRAMGSSHKGILTGRLRSGYGQYFTGTSLGYVSLVALFRMTRRPFLIGGLAIWWGYVRAMMTSRETI